ncbi:MAG: GAF domain-containing protein, partial [Chloroflexi bacterium]|nr:GAF domain-containing protein [Chloroflexota bacterium]
MSIRDRTLLIISLVMIALVAAIYGVSSRILLTAFDSIEQSNAEQDVERALRALENEFRRLDSVARDWASRDDAYDFLGESNPDFVNANLKTTTLLNLNVNQFLYINPQGRIAAGFAADLENGSTGEIAKELIYQLGLQSPLVNLAATESAAQGFMPTQRGLLMLAARPVLTGENQGPSRGSLIVGLYLNAAELQRLQEQTRLTLEYFLLDDPNLPEDVVQARQALTSPPGIAVRPLDNASIAGYAPLPDVNGNPVALLRVVMPRPVHTQANASAWLLIVALIISGVIFTALILLLLERSVLAPLGRLNAAVAQIRVDEAEGKLPAYGGKEISGLSLAINNLLERIRRDRKLEMRLVQLRTAAEISRLISAELELNSLMQQVVNLVEARFNFYYVGIFLVDEKRQEALLQAGSGEAGQAMLAAGHHLALDNTSMIGWCIGHKQPRIALDVGKDAVRFNNPHLPLTRSEMALPLTAGDKTIGAMTIQSTVENAFDQNDIAVLLGIADGLAIAIENAHLFRQAQESLEEVRRLHQKYLAQSWAEVSQSAETFVSAQGVDGESDACREFPITLREQTIGRLQVHSPDGVLSEAD